MGLYFNPGNESFKQALKSKIYVDKTGLIRHTNEFLSSENKCIALSHARRFGKSQAAGMLDAYYSLGSDSRELFAPFEIAKDPDFETHLNKYNVIHVDVSSFEGTYKDEIVAGIKKTVYREMKAAIPDLIDEENAIATILGDVFTKTGKQIVIIIDEWDCVVRNYVDKPEVVHGYLQFLHDLFKSEESKTFLALAYITGILPIKKIENESALNNFREYTMLDSKRLTPYYGFTEEEVKALCDRFDMDFESVRGWYNGYLINGMHMYNPNSVVNAMLDHSLESYWRNTSSFTTINRLITLNFAGLKDDVLNMLAGNRADVETFSFQNDLSTIGSKDEAMTALIHLGYLGYDAENMEAYVPNYEVATAFQAALRTGSWHEVAESIADCDKLLKATIRGQSDKVAEFIEKAHESYASVFKYNDENSLNCVLAMAYFTAPAYYTVIRELPTGKGFADIVLLPRKNAGSRPAIVIELKYDKSADTAIRQIKEKRYAGRLQGYTEKILLVGINYDKESKKHDCIIEEYHG